jgi:hypothetical protein
MKQYLGIILAAILFLQAFPAEATGISYDTSTYNNVGSVSSQTFSFTPSAGSNSLIMVGVDTIDNNGYLVSGITYNSHAMTQIYNYALGSPYNRTIALFGYLNGTADGNAHNVVVTMAGTVSTGIDTIAASYLGVSQTGFPDNMQKVSSTSLGTFTATMTTTANNAWLIGFGASGYGNAAGTNTTQRIYNSAGFDPEGWYDSNGPQTPPGSYSIQMTTPGHTYYGDFVAVSVAPYTAPAPVTTKNQLVIKPGSYLRILSNAFLKILNGN